MKGIITLVALIDALRYDYINKEDSPFLYSLQKKGISGIVREPFAFQLRPAFFAGLYPETSNVGHLYWLDPEDSPFKFTKEMPLQKKIAINERSRNLFKEFLTEEARRIEKFKGHSASALYAEPSEIPSEMLQYFGFSEKINTFEPHSLPYPTLFDILRGNNLNWLWIAYPTDDLRTNAVLKSFKERIKPDHNLVYLHFAELDWLGHDHGPNSDKRKRALKEIDSAISEIFNVLENKFTDIRGLIFGDHGMVEIKSTLDIEGALKHVNLKVPEDYIYFLDSTQARFWFKNENAKNVVIETLKRFSYEGKILDEKDYERLHIRYQHNRFGELFFVANGNGLIYPNFFQRASIVKGMHGYLPDVRDNWGAFIVVSSEAKGKKIEDPVEMVDLFPTILNLMGLPIPKSGEGKSIYNLPTKEKIETGSTKLEKGNKLISVIIPSFNRKDVLKLTLEAFFKQTYPKELYEVIVVDDGSTDRTDQVIEELIKNGPQGRLRYFRQENRGPAAARNKGIKEALGELIVMTGDDCIPNSQFLDEHMKFYSPLFDKNIGVLGRTDLHPGIERTPFLEFIYRGPQFGYQALKHAQDVPYWNYYTSNILINKQKLLEIGLFDENFKYAAWEDIELGYRLYRSGFRLIYNENAVTYHYHEISLQQFIERQRKVGESTIVFYKKHPELRGWLGIDNLVDPNFKNQFYNAMLTYIFLVGVQGALRTGVNKADKDVIQIIDELDEKKSRYQAYLEIELEKSKLTCIELENRTKATENQLAVLSNELNILSNELNTLKSSISYRLMQPITAKIYQIFPEGTRFGELRKVIVNSLNILLTQGFKRYLKYLKEKIKRKEFKIV